MEYRYALNTINQKAKTGKPFMATILTVSREALDSYWKNPSAYKFKEEWMDMLKKVSHRPYHTGFYLGINGEQNYEDSSYVRDYEIVGMVKEYDAETQTATILQKNRVFEGDEVEVLRPDVPYFKIKLEDMYDLDKNKKTDVANRAHMMFKVKVNEMLYSYSCMEKYIPFYIFFSWNYDTYSCTFDSICIDFQKNRINR